MIRLKGLEERDPAPWKAEVEAQLPFNCEHVVPQSWFGKREPMRGDLHHLFACESRCNGFRGNTPFTDFPDFPPAPQPDDGPDPRAVRDDCGKSASNGFEPAHGKGAAARAAFYFRLHYPEHISAEEMSDDRWPVLMDWHEQDPVSDWERHRNAAIAERQGNRNPFIDHPVVAWYPGCGFRFPDNGSAVGVRSTFQVLPGSDDQRRTNRARTGGMGSANPTSTPRRSGSKRWPGSPRFGGRPRAANRRRPRERTRTRNPASRGTVD